MRSKLRGGVVVALALFAFGLRANDAVPYSAATAQPVAVTHAAAERAALAGALARLYTHHPAQLVDVIENAAGTTPGSPSVTLLLSIAYAETSGDVPDVS